MVVERRREEEEEEDEVSRGDLMCGCNNEQEWPCAGGGGRIGTAAEAATGVVDR